MLPLCTCTLLVFVHTIITMMVITITVITIMAIPSSPIFATWLKAEGLVPGAGLKVARCRRPRSSSAVCGVIFQLSTKGETNG